jgi:hypothetical protein
MRKYFDRFEKIVISFIALGILILFIAHVTRDTQYNEITTASKEIKPDNYLLSVYTGMQPLKIRTSTKVENNEAIGNNVLQHGELFVFLKDKIVSEEITSNFPFENISEYHFNQIGSFNGDQYETNSIVLEKTDMFNGSKKTASNVFFNSSSQQEFTSYIFDQLVAAGWDKHKERYRSGSFERYGAFLGVEILEDTKFYNRNHEAIGTLKKGAFVYTTFDHGFVIGRDNTSMIGVVGRMQPNDEMITVKTIFLEIKRDKRGLIKNIATTIDQKKVKKDK